MPAYVYFLKVKPGGSNIAGIPPTAEREVTAPVLDPEDAARVVDEAAVLVGNFPTIDDADDFHDKVRQHQAEGARRTTSRSSSGGTARA